MRSEAMSDLTPEQMKAFIVNMPKVSGGAQLLSKDRPTLSFLPFHRSSSVSPENALGLSEVPVARLTAEGWQGSCCEVGIEKESSERIGAE